MQAVIIIIKEQVLNQFLSKMKKSRSKYQSHLLLQNLPFLTCNIEVVTFLFFLTLQVLSSTVVIVRSSNIIETSSHVVVDAPNSKTWIISKDLCNDDFPYCKCSSFHNITIICSCNESTETTTNEVSVNIVRLSISVYVMFA